MIRSGDRRNFIIRSHPPEVRPPFMKMGVTGRDFAETGCHGTKGKVAKMVEAFSSLQFKDQIGIISGSSAKSLI
jgi:hypothetical protein